MIAFAYSIREMGFCFRRLRSVARSVSDARVVAEQS